MKNVKRWLLVAGMASAMTLGYNEASAQDQGGGRRGNFDPAQFQQMMMDRIREQMDVKSDDDWKVIQPRLEKVMEARRNTMSGGMGFGMMGGRRRGGGDGGTGGGGAGGGAGRSFFGEPSPEAEALQRAIESKASASEMKTALEKYRAAQKKKQEELQKAQTDLQKVLSVQQEAVAVMMGLLN